MSDERERVRAVYAAYEASAGRQRAWSADNPGNRAIRDELARRLLKLAEPAITAKLPILDVGCGTGWWLARLATEGVAPQRLFGIEILAERLTKARDAVPGADVREGDARKLPWRDASFGLVTVLTMLSSLADPEAQRTTLLEARRVTAPEGLTVIWEPRWPTPWNRHRMYVPADVYADLPAASTRHETISLLPPIARRLGRATPRIYPILAAVPVLRSHRLVIARADPTD